VEQNKARTSRDHGKTKEMELDWTYIKANENMVRQAVEHLLVGKGANPSTAREA
jgi:hypothetical protein